MTAVQLCLLPMAHGLLSDMKIFAKPELLLVESGAQAAPSFLRQPASYDTRRVLAPTYELESAMFKQ